MQTSSTAPQSLTPAKARSRDPKKYIKYLLNMDVYNKSDESNAESQRRLLKVSILCVVFMLAEVVGGYISNSIAIMTDAAHLLSDLLSFFVSIFALRLAQRGTTREYNFGYHRAEVIGALGSIAIIWVLTGWLLIEAVFRFISPPEEFNPVAMMITAALGVVVNIIMGMTLHQGSQKHFHSHLLGGSCEGHGHKHGGSNISAEPDAYELMDITEKRIPLRARSLEVSCEKNLSKNQNHHHHEKETNIQCCEKENCSDSRLLATASDAEIKNGHTHIGCNGHDHDHHDHDHHDEEAGENGKNHNHEGCNGHHHEHDHDHEHDHEHDHDDHDHDDHDHEDKGKTPAKAHDHANCGGHDHDHNHEEHKHEEGGCAGHDHGHDDHDHEGHKHAEGGCGGHDHGHEDHNHGSSHSAEGMNINIRAAFIHIVGDLIQSIGVLIVALVIWYRPAWVWFDPLCTVFFSVIVVFTTVPVSQECTRVLMESAPDNIDIPHLQTELERVPRVLGIFELRVWNITESKRSAILKVLVDRYSSDTVPAVRRVFSGYGVQHTVVEVEVFKP